MRNDLYGPATKSLLHRTLVGPSEVQIATQPVYSTGDFGPLHQSKCKAHPEFSVDPMDLVSNQREDKSNRGDITLMDSRTQLAGRWGVRCSRSDDGDLAENDQLHHFHQNHDQEIVAVDNDASDEVFAVECFLDNGGEDEANRANEDQLFEIASLLGITMEGHVGELRKFIHDMLV